MARVAYKRGVAVASAAAGPLFLLALVHADGPRGGLDAASLGGGAIALLWSIPFGFLVAAVPNLIGAAALAAIGRDNIGVRLPVFWALVGAGLGAALDRLIAVAGQAPAPAPIFVFVAPACALLCRWGTRWAD